MEYSRPPPSFCFTFELHGKLYGVDALAVRETARLPAIDPVEDGPGDLVGVVNLRGTVIPVLDLGIRLGAGAGTWGLSDWLLVLEQNGLLVGLIAHDIREVMEIPPGAWTPADAALVAGTDGMGGGISHVVGVAAPAGEMIQVLDGERLAREGEQMVRLLEPSTLFSSSEASPEGAVRRFSPGGDADVGKILKARAENLRSTVHDEEKEGAEASLFSVVALGGELLAFPMEELGGFTRLTGAGGAAPIPGCPSHIHGCAAFQGEIRTLVDVRELLGLPHDAAASLEQVVWVELDQGRVGVMVEELLDVVSAIPRLSGSDGSHGERLAGSIPYGEGMAGVASLKQLLSSPHLIVDQEG